MIPAYGYALAAVVASALIKVINRTCMHAGSNHWGTLIYYNLLGAGIMALVLPMPDFSAIDRHLGLVLLGNAVLWVAAGLYDLKSYKYLSATDSDVFGSVRLIILTAAGVVLFGEHLSAASIAGIGLILAAMLANSKVASLTWNRGIAYKFISCLLMAAALVIDKYLATEVSPGAIAILGFLLPGSLYVMLRIRSLHEVGSALRVGGAGMAATPLLGGVRYYCILQALALGDLITTTIILQSCVVLVYLFELSTLRKQACAWQRGICCACCAAGAAIVCIN